MPRVVSIRISNDLPQLFLRSGVKPLRRRHASQRVHPHVERTVLPETETAPGIINLGRGHAQVEQNAVDLSDLPCRERRSQLGETGVDHLETRILYAAAGCDRLGIFVEGDQPPLPAEALENRSAVAATTKCSVHIHPCGPSAINRKRIDGLP